LNSAESAKIDYDAVRCRAQIGSPQALMP